nr:DUF4145 domain-containing protein [uncultured Cellulosilyticum sp.]
MDSFDCPFCGKSVAITDETYRLRSPSFNKVDIVFGGGDSGIDDDTIDVFFFKCPSCNNTQVVIIGVGDQFKDKTMYFHPNSLAKQYPNYIPNVIRNDYEEACAIVNLSPKASATLARRCLQGMIRDFWNVSEKNLYSEISAIKDKIQPDLWKALDSLRQLGNIGAHMEKDTNVIVDIEPDEANKLIKLIELLMGEWYINRHKRKQLFSDILETNQQKQEERKAN